ncbi:ClpXP protease specificity-enhancing factor [Candidatus Nitrosacidococcus tergens]|uniref:Stringent starvation protein B n=1 Tax=Candidatus Nitrosacidococcus tergens TaxID=553981 RepID=A0A7G1Q7B6_9GAMM|nr:ClpXP protease specificity-enhancing factor [Candidatus Nitrosacidococcus tergens]CAB1274275.1 Stringent starvation protein B [Candidatus Nitrosacidococcus tergens]
MGNASNPPFVSSSRPYLIRAFYEWITDNQLTPYLVVNATFPDVKVPEQYISDGKIILNIHPYSVKDLSLKNDWISFSGRFSGIVHEVIFPVQATLAIYAKENGQGMTFPQEDLPPPTSPSDKDTKDKSRKPMLRVVK